MGEPNDDGQYVVKFGVLFDDDEAANTFEAINGTLRTAKKRQIIDFKGQMLLKGPHDNVPITLLIQNNDNDDDMEEEEDNNDNNLEQQTEDTNNVATDDTNIDENINNNIQQQQTSIIIKQDEEVKQEEESINKEDMIEIRGRCKQAGCKCNKFIENPSKWSKGKCKSCGHEGNKHQMQWVKKSELQCSPVPKPKATVLSNRHSPSPSPGPQSPSISLAESVESPVVEQDVMVKEEEQLENQWGEEFTVKLGQCVTETFEYDKESILPAKYLLHYLKKRIGFDFKGQTKHRDALQFVCVEKFGWKAINDWGYSIRVV